MKTNRPGKVSSIRGINRMSDSPNIISPENHANPWKAEPQSTFIRKPTLDVAAARGVHNRTSSPVSRVKESSWCDVFDISPWVASNAERKRARWEYFPSRFIR